MVYFCCVNGCRNNDHQKDLDVSFHVFPHNTNLKRQWLKAIGRPNWNPPSYARVCGAHFANGKPGIGTGISHCLFNISQTHSNYEATEDDVCYFCLNSDVKMYSLEDETLRICYESVVLLNNSSLEDLPKFICYECKANLLKCYNFIQKAITCQATIKDIFEEHGQINKILARSKDREGLNLKSSLRRNFVTPTHLFEYTFDEDQGTSQLKKVVIDIAEERDKSYTNIENCYREDEENIKRIDTSNGDSELRLENQYSKSNEGDDDCNTFYEDKDVIFISAGVDHDHNYSVPLKEGDDIDISRVKSEIDDDIGETEKNNENSPDASPVSGDDNNDDTDKDDEADELEAFFNSVKAEDLQPLKESRIHMRKAKKIKEKYEKEEKEMEKNFNIVKLSLQEQKEQFEKSIEIRRKQTNVEYRCDTCFKVFLTLSACKKHVYYHDPKQRGVWECPVCLLRFRTREYLWGHSYGSHDYMYHCKSCPYSVSHRGGAVQHAREHAAGYRSSCPLCPFKGKHPSSVTFHVRRRHPEQAKTCDICKLVCVSTKGLKVHMSVAHSEKSNETDVYPCEKCGINFKSEDDKLTHLRTSPAHSNDDDDELISSALKPAKKNKLSSRCYRQKLANRGYPKKCDHCDLEVSSRYEHWQHVRTKHRDKKHAYRAIVGVICEICGRGLVDSGALKIHLLQHGPPSFACADCPRVFHDKYALSRHVRVHRPDLPHRCDQCPSAFKRRSNLLRHTKVHSDVAAYECKICFKKMKYPSSYSLHMKTVHYGLPHPPRKKRTLKKKKEE